MIIRSVVRAIAKAIFIMATTLNMSACAHPECSQYYPFVEAGAARNSILNWADSEIFAKDLASAEVSGTVLLGPGRRRVRSVAGSILELPRQLEDGYFSKLVPIREPQVLALGEDKAHPVAIFIGRASYRGLVVSRKEMLGTLHELDMNIERNFLVISDRVAIMCYPD